MTRLPVLAAFAALSAAAAWAALPSRAAVAVAAPDERHAMYAACAKVCGECLVECAKMTHHCGELVAAGKKEHLKPMELAADCSDLCAVAAKLTGRHSDLAPAACEACAKACDLCAAACYKFPDMPEMKACAAKCRECAKACKEMAKMGGHAGHEKK